MKIACFILAAAVSAVVASASWAQTLVAFSNVKTPVAAKLVDQTCVGGFTVEKATGPQSQGALRLTFFSKGDVLSARFERAFGVEAFKNPGAVKAFDNLGEVTGLQITPTGALYFANSANVDWTFQVRDVGGRLVLESGTFDPSRANKNWKSGTATGRC